MFFQLINWKKRTFVKEHFWEQVLVVFSLGKQMDLSVVKLNKQQVLNMTLYLQLLCLKS